nr:hypothetical protein MFMH1_26400 [Myxococcus sp. MH1]
MPSKNAGASLKEINDNIQKAFARRERWAQLSSQVSDALKAAVQRANGEAGPASDGALSLSLEQVPHWDDSRAFEVRFSGKDIGLVKSNGAPAGPVHAHGASLRIAPLVNGLVGASYTPGWLTLGEEQYGEKPELALLGVFEPEEIAKADLLEDLLAQTLTRAATDHWASGGSVRASGK